MKKLGLISVAAAVALTSSAFASEIKMSGFASVSGVSKSVQETESNEYYDMDSELYVDVKNDDGIMIKLGWDIYDGQFGNVGTSAGSNTSLGLLHGYVIAPLGNLTLKTGYVEAGAFGPSAFDTDASAFKLSLAYKISDDLTVAFTDKQITEGSTASKGGGMLEGGDGDNSAYYLDAKGKVAGMKYGVRYYSGVDKTSTTDDKYTGHDVFVDGTFGGVNVAFENVSKKADTYSDAKTGSYIHGLVGMGQLTTGLAYVMADKGQGTGTLFDPTVITDKILHEIPSSTSDSTAVAVIPVIYKASDDLSVNAAFATGNVTGKSLTEIDVSASYKLGKQTTASFTYATASGDITSQGTDLDGSTSDSADGITYMAYKVKVAF